MFASDLRKGDTFVECAPDTYAELSRKEQRDLRVWTVKHDAIIGLRCPGRVHVVLEGATWCIPAVAELTRVDKPKKAEKAA